MRCKLFAAALAVLLSVFMVALNTGKAWAADVTVGDEVVFRIDNAEQAAKISAKLEKMLQAGNKADGVYVRADVKTVKGESPGVDDWGDPLPAPVAKSTTYVIVWDGETIITVTHAMAKANNSTPKDLAEVWAKNIRKVVAIGLLKTDVSSLVVLVGKTVSFHYSGLAKGDLVVTELYGRTLLDVDDEQGLVTVTGRSIGKTKITLQRGKGTATVSLHVKDVAGTLPEAVEVEVTGHPASAEVVSQASLLGIASDTRVNPGCAVYVDQEGFTSHSVTSGDTMTLSVPVGIAPGEDYVAVRGRVLVHVKNIVLEPVESNLLLVSNRPERVDKDGILLQYVFTRKEPTRLMYSHLNESAGTRNLWVNLTNPTDKPLKLMVNWTVAGPEKSEVHVGQAAAKRFLQSIATDSGFILRLEPNSIYELAAHEMRSKALVSGFAVLRILEGEEAGVEVRTALAPSYNDGSSMPDIGAPFNPFKIHPHGAFAQPFFELDGELSPADQKPLTFRYGESPWLIDFNTGLPNTGNFGVLYKALVDLKNNGPVPVHYDLIFKPLSGPAGGTFVVNGEVFQAPFRKPGNEFVVTSFDVAPGSVKTVEVTTFPEASSCYPCQFEFKRR